MARANPGAYACVLMDMQMPEMDGLEATRALRADPAFADLPIIAMTANAMKQDLDACLAAGMNDYITKPIDRAVLAATLRKWLPHRRGRPRDVGRRPAVTRTRAEASAGPGARRHQRATARWLAWASASTRLQRMLIRFADGQAEDGGGPARGGRTRATPTRRARHAHAIAGAAGNLGADTLREAAKALETAARAGERRPGRPRAAGRGTGRGGVPLDRQPAHARKPEVGAAPGAGATPPPPEGAAPRHPGPRCAGRCSRSAKPSQQRPGRHRRPRWRRSAGLQLPETRLAPPSTRARALADGLPVRRGGSRDRRSLLDTPDNGAAHREGPLRQPDPDRR